MLIQGAFAIFVNAHETSVAGRHEAAELKRYNVAMQILLEDNHCLAVVKLAV